MIDIQKLFWSLAEYGKEYVSGNDPIGEFNSKTNESQFDMFDMLTPEYSKNERVRILLEPFTRRSPETSDALGVVTKPTDFHRVLGGRYINGGKTHQIYYAKENEIIESDFIPQRKASLERGIAYFTYVGDTVLLTPKESITLDMHYLVRPKEVKLVYDYNVTPESYVQLSTDTVNLEWGMDAYNLILNILLLKYSLISRDQFKTEIATLGLTLDKINS